MFPLFKFSYTNTYLFSTYPILHLIHLPWVVDGTGEVPEAEVLQEEEVRAISG